MGPAAAVGAGTEAWLAGPDCIQRAQQPLAGPARQTHLCSSSSSCSSICITACIPVNLHITKGVESFSA